MAKPLGPAKGYVDMLDEVLVAQDRENQVKMRKDKSPLRPSSAGECARKLVYGLREHLGLDEVTVEDRPARILRIFSLGHFIESHILSLYRKVDEVNMGLYNQQVVGVVEYEDGTLTEGSVDMGMLTESGLGLGDAKSKGDKFSVSHKSAWDEQADAYANFASCDKISDTFFWIEDLDAFLKELKDPFFRMNFYQLNAYIHSDFFQRRNCDHGSIIQYNKNDSRMREFRFKPSRNVYDYVVKKFQTVKANAETPENVEKEHSPGSVKCAYCPYASRCWPNTDTKKEFFATFPKRDWPKDTNRMGAAGQKLESLYESYIEAKELDTIQKEIEGEIVKLMDQQRVNKIRFSDGNIYIMKPLKKGPVLRRSKL